MQHIVIGPPCSGKSTFIRESAEEGDVLVDFDKIAEALGNPVPHGSEGEIKKATFAARESVISYVLENDSPAWIIHSFPTADDMERYEGCDIVFMETPKETCLERAESDNRPDWTAEVIEDWFERFGSLISSEKTEKKGHSMKKSFDVQVEAKDGGTVRAYASTFDREPDSYGDVIAPNAFDKTLEKWRELGKPIPLLWGHDTSDPFSNIGGCIDYGTDERGLWYEAEFDPENEKAQYVRKLCQEGRVYQCSFAFEVKDYGTVTLEDGTKANELREIDLFEISIVQIPANQHATIEDAKSAKSGRRTSKADSDSINEALTIIEETEERLDVAKEIIRGLLPADDTETETVTEPTEGVPEGSDGQTDGDGLEKAKAEVYKRIIRERI